jgi:P-type conjugative transfer protein TrbJ
MKKLLNQGLLGAALATGSLAGVTLWPAPAYAIPVFDGANYAQNMLTAARTLQQINQQIQSLQNEAAMLQNQARNLSRIDFPQMQQLRQRLQRIDQLMGQAQGVDFRVDQLDRQLQQLYPGNFQQLLGRDQRAASARARLDAEMSAFRQNMGVQSRIDANVHEDAETLSEIVARSQGAEGSLQAQQATNQLLALTAQQQLQIQTLMAAHFRARALEASRRAQVELESREQVRRYLGDGHAYTPQPPH